jgi:hypothetical protein
MRRSKYNHGKIRRARENNRARSYQEVLRHGYARAIAKDKFKHESKNQPTQNVFKRFASNMI